MTPQPPKAATRAAKKSAARSERSETGALAKGEPTKPSVRALQWIYRCRFDDSAVDGGKYVAVEMSLNLPLISRVKRRRRCTALRERKK